jgi:hypothetical protein
MSACPARVLTALRGDAGRATPRKFRSLQIRSTPSFVAARSTPPAICPPALAHLAPSGSLPVPRRLCVLRGGSRNKRRRQLLAARHGRSMAGYAAPPRPRRCCWRERGRADRTNGCGTGDILLRRTPPPRRQHIAEKACRLGRYADRRLARMQRQPPPGKIDRDPLPPVIEPGRIVLTQREIIGAAMKAAGPGVERLPRIALSAAARKARKAGDRIGIAGRHKHRCRRMERTGG